MSKQSALLKKYKEDPKKMTSKMKDDLIREYSPLIKFIAQKIAVRLPSNIELDDLISAGVIGLMDAICPPSTQMAAFNRITSHKELLIYPDFGHEHLPQASDIVFNFMADL